MKTRGLKRLKKVTIGAVSAVAAIAAIVVMGAAGLAGCEGKGGGGSNAGNDGAPSRDYPKSPHIEGLPDLDVSDTLAGTDANNNGVRDDIEIYILENYPEEKQQKAAFQYARSRQAIMLLDVKDREAVRRVEMQSAKAFNCLFATFKANPNAENRSIVLDKIVSMTANTKKRFMSARAFDMALNGTVLSSPEGDTCE